MLTITSVYPTFHQWETFLFPGDKINVCTLSLRTRHQHNSQHQQEHEWRLAVLIIVFTCFISSRRSSRAGCSCLSFQAPPITGTPERSASVTNSRPCVSWQTLHHTNKVCVCVMITEVNRVGRVCSARLFANLWEEEHAHIQHLLRCYILTFRQAAFTELFWIKETDRAGWSQDTLGDSVWDFTLQLQKSSRI